MLMLAAMPSEHKPLRERLYQRLFNAVENLPKGDRDREVDEAELMRLGCDQREARMILERLSDEKGLGLYLGSLSEKNVAVTTRISPEYPEKLKRTLGAHSPLTLVYVGNAALFHSCCISLVGSRKLREKGTAFARKAGACIAREGYTYCSGGAEGADTEGLLGAMEAGGSAVLYLAGNLEEAMQRPLYAGLLQEGRLLLVSEEASDCGFSGARALARNRLIHGMGEKTLVAQSDYGSGGTWRGTLENLKNGWSPVLVSMEEPEDPGARGLVERGAVPVTAADLPSLSALEPSQCSLF